MKIHHNCHMTNLEDVKLHERLATMNEAFYAKLLKITDSITNEIMQEISQSPERMELGVPDGEFYWDASSAVRHAIDREGSEIISEDADQYAILLIRFESKLHIFISAEFMRIDSMDIMTPYGEQPMITGIRFSTYN